MGFSISFACRQCDWHVSAGGLKMYYETPRGERGYIQHPGEESDLNFRAHGLRGYVHDFVCPNCGQGYVVYFPFSGGPRRDAYYGAAEEASIGEAKRASVKCDCGASLMYSVSLKERLDAGEEVHCPKCPDGKLSLGDQYVS